MNILTIHSLHFTCLNLKIISINKYLNLQLVTYIPVSQGTFWLLFDIIIPYTQTTKDVPELTFFYFFLFKAEFFLSFWWSNFCVFSPPSFLCNSLQTRSSAEPPSLSHPSSFKWFLLSFSPSSMIHILQTQCHGAYNFFCQFQFIS